LAIKEIINAALRRAGLTTTANNISTAIEDELRLTAFEGQQPGLFHLIERRLKERGTRSVDHARAVFIFTANKFDMKLPTFTGSEKHHLGVKLVELFAAATGYINIEPVRMMGRKRKVQYQIKIAPEAGEWINDRNVRAEFLRPYYMPTVIPPREWTGLYGGGYHTDQLNARPLVKSMSKAQAKALEAADLTTVLDSLNAIQNTPWRINTRILDLMREVWDRDLDIGMPNREDLPIPPKPPGFKDVQGPGAWVLVKEEDKKAWKQEARATHEANATSRGRRLLIEMMLATADELKGEEKIYFPHQLDFRGRAYAMPVGLNPQGSDHARALLLFARGKPIETPRAAGWLAIQGANIWGYDKVDLEGRIAWVQERHDRIEATARDPMADLWWTEADGGKKAWSFLAWIFEYAAFLEHGHGYVSSLPISVDGSCNGLQHFSAMLRDPIGGAAVNLIPSEKPSDIYGLVADRVNEKLSESDDWMDQVWLAFKVDRKITKRPVMVLPYGGTFRSCMQYVREATHKRIAETGVNPFGAELQDATAKLSKMVWYSISDVVVAARQVMDWLMKVARIAAKAGVTLTWTTPSGFVAYQGYRETTKRRIKTHLHGSIIWSAKMIDGTKLDPRRQANGISPNFVHSMDAAAMMLTIELAKLNGLDLFAMIHDSYGTVAADMDMLAACLREAFVRMYVEHNVLEEFLRNLPQEVKDKLPPIPPMGQLDIEAIRDSQFFFA
jgi:DNA-directed RNA polymerase